MLADLSIAITGAASPGGRALRAVLAEKKVPVERLRFLETPSEEAILSEYAGQAILIAPLEPEAIADRDLVFLCGAREESERCLTWPRKAGSLIVDSSGAGACRGQQVVQAGLGAEAVVGRSGPVNVPHPISWAVSSLLAPLEKGPGIDRAATVVLLPAADFGEEGVEELHQQTVAILSFGTSPKEVFGRQLAFNLLPGAAVPLQRKDGILEKRLVAEVASVLGWDAPRASVLLVVAPVFEGHAMAIHVHLERESTEREILGALAADGNLDVGTGNSGVLSPVESLNGRRLCVARLTGGAGAGKDWWLWAVGSDLRRWAAMNAVEIAESWVAAIASGREREP